MALSSKLRHASCRCRLESGYGHIICLPEGLTVQHLDKAVLSDRERCLRRRYLWFSCWEVRRAGVWRRFGSLMVSTFVCSPSSCILR